MRFSHAPEIWLDFPELAAGAISAAGIHDEVSVEHAVAAFEAVAASRLDGGAESELPEIQAWRRTYARMGLKPTQYRSAAESLLRRFRKEGTLPRIHPLIDLCNAASLAFAIPVAVFDTASITGSLQVRRATGCETYETFGGETEHPAAGEVIFADDADRAHARRWSNRQSGDSLVRSTTSAVLVVAEALHETAAADVERLIATLAATIESHWTTVTRSTMLTPASPSFDVS